MCFWCFGGLARLFFAFREVVLGLGVFGFWDCS